MSPTRQPVERKNITMKHSIERTNPKGVPFIGVCVLCGERDLSFEDATKDCPNVRGLSPDEAVIEAIQGTRRAGR